MLKWQKASKQRGAEEPPKANAYPGSRRITSSLSSPPSFPAASQKICRKILLRRRMKERTRAQIRAGATRTRSPSFDSDSGEKELRNWVWNGKCRVTERASWSAPRHWQTNQRTHTSITQLARSTASHEKRESGERRAAAHAFIYATRGRSFACHAQRVCILEVRRQVRGAGTDNGTYRISLR